MKRVILVGVLLIAGASAAVVQQTTHEVMHGELNTAPADLVVAPQGVQSEALGQSPAGTTPATAIEIDLVAGLATTGVAIGNQAYTVEVRELLANGIAAGNYSAQLKVDGTPQGTLYFKQDTGLSASIEAVRLTWDIGATLSPGSVVYELSVAAI